MAPDNPSVSYGCVESTTHGTPVVMSTDDECDKARADFSKSSGTSKSFICRLPITNYDGNKYIGLSI